MALAVLEMPVGTRRFNEWAQEVADLGAIAHIRDVHSTHDGSMVFATMNPAAMAELLFVSDWTITDQDSPSPDKRGYQRPIKSARIPTIAKYFVSHFEAGDLRIPPVILSVRHVAAADRETFISLLRAGDIEAIHSRFSHRAVCIVDGQHRTGGGFDALIRLGGKFDVLFPVVAYFDLDYETEADWFTVINSTAQPIPKSLLEWTKLDITEAHSDSPEQRIRRITERLASEANAPFENEVNFGGGRQLGRHITFEGLRRSTTDFFGGPKARLLERIIEEGIDPYTFSRDYWRAVIEACSEAWQADPAGPVKYRIKELVAIAALAKLGATLTEQAIIQGQHGAKIAKFVAEKATRLSSVDWTKDDTNQWMRPQAGFAGQTPLYEILKDWVLLGRQPGGVG
jgi:DGQHR domain-containing protein